MEPHIRYAAPGKYHTLHVDEIPNAQRIHRVNQNPWSYMTGKTTMNEEDFAILRGLYDGEISYVDYRVGQLVTMLRVQGALSNTVLIVTSDHGENLGEHGLMDHAYCLYDTLLHVPLIICFPSDFPSGERITEQVQTLDLFPTILHLAGVHDEEVWGQVQGHVLFPAEAPRGKSERLAIAEYMEPQPPLKVLRDRYPGFSGNCYDRSLRTLRTKKHKYIWASDGRDELYDIAADPGETRNLIAAEPHIAQELREKLEAWLKSFDGSGSRGETVDLDQVVLKRLEDLGYLG
jgi:arylsulfatase A-like enzyme